MYKTNGRVEETDLCYVFPLLGQWTLELLATHPHAHKRKNYARTLKNVFRPSRQVCRQTVVLTPDKVSQTEPGQHVIPGQVWPEKALGAPRRLFLSAALPETSSNLAPLTRQHVCQRCVSAVSVRRVSSVRLCVHSSCAACSCLSSQGCCSSLLPATGGRCPIDH